MTKRDWQNIPFNHTEWTRKYKSIMNPSGQVTWPQLLMEMIIYNRRKYIAKYKELALGPGWSKAIGGEIRRLTQQSYQICNFFANPNNDPLVEVAIRNFVNKTNCLTYGCVKKNGEITQQAKDFINGVECELNKLKQKVTITKTTEAPKPIQIAATFPNKNKNSLESILELEKRIGINNG